MFYKIILSSIALCLPLIAHAQFNNPQGLAFDSSGDLWVANEGSNQVLRFGFVRGRWVEGKPITKGMNGPTRLFFCWRRLVCRKHHWQYHHGI
jgi:hypothetical protein